MFLAKLRHCNVGACINCRVLCFLDAKGVSEQSELGLTTAEVLGGWVGAIRFLGLGQDHGCSGKLEGKK